MNWRPVLDRLFSGAGVSLLVALTTVTISALIGIALGLVAGYFGGVTDRLISRVIEIFLFSRHAAGNRDGGDDRSWHR